MPAHRLLRMVLATTLLCCCAFTATAVELPREMTTQYRTAVERFKEAYSHATITGTLKHEEPQARRFRDQQFVYRAAGANLRADLTTTAQRGMGLDVGATDMYMAAPYASLHTYRGPTSDVFDTADEESYQAVRSHIEQACPFTKVFSLGGRETVLELLRSQSVTITKVDKVTLKGSQVIKISFQQTSRTDGSHVGKSWLTVSPGEGWGLREYFRATSNGGREVIYRGTVAYSGTEDGVPLVQQIETWEEHGAHRDCVKHEVIRVSGFTPGDPDHDYFAAFGLGPGRDPK